MSNRAENGRGDVTLDRQDIASTARMSHFTELITAPLVVYSPYLGHFVIQTWPERNLPIRQGVPLTSPSNGVILLTR